MKTKLDLEGRNIEIGLMTIMFHIDTNVSAAAAAKSLQSCPTLCDPRDSSPPGFPVPGILQASSPPGFPVPGILQARTLEWVAISFSKFFFYS